jgi:hypothetical protein
MLASIAATLVQLPGFYDNSSVADPSVDVLIKWIQGEEVDMSESIVSLGNALP